MSPRTFGVDEAGRGPVLGPMAIAVVGLEAGAARALRRAGVCDSKAFTGAAAVARRAALAERIRDRAAYHACVLVSVEEIDRSVTLGGLNVLERRVAADLLRAARVQDRDRIVCDGARLFAQLRAEFSRLRAVDRGESAHVSVAAASILAKDARDTAFAAVRQRYEPEFGPLAGGGYPNAATTAFLMAYRRRHGHWPPETRTSWATVQDERQLALFERRR
jgi:ribonuclease HII